MLERPGNNFFEVEKYPMKFQWARDAGSWMMMILLLQHSKSFGDAQLDCKADL